MHSGGNEGLKANTQRKLGWIVQGVQWVDFWEDPET